MFYKYHLSCLNSTAMHYLQPSPQIPCFSCYFCYHGLFYASIKANYISDILPPLCFQRLYFKHFPHSFVCVLMKDTGTFNTIYCESIQNGLSDHTGATTNLYRTEILGKRFCSLQKRKHCPFANCSKRLHLCTWIYYLPSEKGFSLLNDA